MQGSIKGKITGIDDASRISQRYRYDAQGRLDFALTQDALYGSRYDANGNRTRLSVNGQHIDYAHSTDSNRLIQTRAAAPAWHAPMQINALSWASHSAAPITPLTHTSASIHYKSSGEITHLGSFTFRYNANGQPEHLYQGDAHRASYQYNSRAQRIAKKTASGKTTHYLYENNRLSAEINEQGRVQRQYLYLDHHPIAILELGQNYAVHTNHLGAPIAVTDQNQTLIWQARYAPFGQAEVDEDPDGNGIAFTLNLRLPGQYCDEESGLHYNHHRYYDPIACRYISSDPLGLAAGPNTYAYVENDPVNHIDPTGLLLFAFDGTDNSDKNVPGRQTTVYQFREAYRGDPRELNTRVHPGDPERVNWYYMTGAGRHDERSSFNAGTFDQVNLDIAFGTKTGARVAVMAEYFYSYIVGLDQAQKSGYAINDYLDIDIVGFSRGASQARIFANLLDAFLNGDDDFLILDTVVFDDTRHGGTFGNEYADFQRERPQRAREIIQRLCLNLNLRFLGLWDTVTHIGTSQKNDSRESDGNTGDTFQGIPDRVKYTAHAFSVNERREAFGSWSIYDRPEQQDQEIAPNSTRPLPGSTGYKIEKGFLGGHADIGGGFENSDLSDVAFMWMIDRAMDAGIPAGSDRGIDLNFIDGMRWNRVTRPFANDLVYEAPLGFDFIYNPGRLFRYLDAGEGTDVLQEDLNVPAGSRFLSFEQSIDFLETNIYADTSDKDDGLRVTELKKQPSVPVVSGIAPPTEAYLYQAWLKNNYDLDISITDGASSGGAGP